MSFGDKETQSVSCPSVDSIGVHRPHLRVPSVVSCFLAQWGSRLRIETSLHKQSHPFRDSSLSPLHDLRRIIPLQPSHSPSSFVRIRRELHSRVYHCPDNNDLPTRKLLRVGAPSGWKGASGNGETLIERRDEVNPMTGSLKKASETGSHLAFGSISL